jgi:hypothetical protein
VPIMALFFLMVGFLVGGVYLYFWIGAGWKKLRKAIE